MEDVQGVRGAYVIPWGTYDRNPLFRHIDVVCAAGGNFWMAQMMRDYAGGRRGDGAWECELARRLDLDAIQLRGCSRRYDFQLSFQLSAAYGYEVDPGQIVRYVDELVGGTFLAWERSGVDRERGHAMAQALWPHWQGLIGEFMTRLEYESRGRRTPERWYGHGVTEYLRNGRIGDYTGFEFYELLHEDPKAKEKARRLLMRNLDAGQLKSFKAEGWFHVTGADGVRYKISTARSFNVEAADGTRYCGQLTETPIEDQMLAQKLLLQSDPKEFIKKCNVSPGRGGDVYAIFDEALNTPDPWIRPTMTPWRR